MTRRNWKLVRPNSAIDALRLCKEYAQEKKNLSIERIADRMGVTHDSLYKWLSAGRLPFILLPAFEHACGCHFASEWAAASAGKVVISIPTGRNVAQGDLVELNSGFGAALHSYWLTSTTHPTRPMPARRWPRLTTTWRRWHGTRPMWSSTPTLNWSFEP